MENIKKVCTPGEFIELILSYETDETKLEQIKELLNSDRREIYLYGEDGIGPHSLIVSIKRKLRIRKFLLQNIAPHEIDDEYIQVLLHTSVKYHDVTIIKFIIDNFLNRLRLFDANNIDIFFTVFRSQNSEIINLFLDLYDSFDIFERIGYMDKSIYEKIFTDLSSQNRDFVLENLMKHRYYSPTILGQTIDNFNVLAGILPDLVGEKNLDLADINHRKYIRFYKRAESIKKFRDECLPEVPDKVKMIKLFPESMEVKAAQYHFEMNQIYGSNITEEQKKEYYDNIISKNTKFCEYYSIYSADDISKMRNTI
jgi:hypothetical protein